MLGELGAHAIDYQLGLLSPNHHPSKVLIKSNEYVGIGNRASSNMYK